MEIIQKIFNYDNTFHDYYKTINNEIFIYSKVLNELQKQLHSNISLIQLIKIKKNHETLFKSLLFKYTNKKNIKIITIDYRGYSDIIKKIPIQCIIILSKIDNIYKYFYIKNKILKDKMEQIFVCPQYHKIINKIEIDSYVVGELL